MGLRTQSIAAQVANTFSNASSTQSLSPVANVTFQQTTANVITANTIIIGGVNVNTAITSNATAAYSNAIAYSANATNLGSGTVSFTRLPSLYLGTTAIQSTSAAQAVSGVTTLATGNTSITGFANVSTTLQVGANVVLGTTTISANGGVGTAGQVLTSGATGNVYWANAATFSNGQSITVANLTATGNVTFSNTVTFSTTGAMVLPVGNTAQRPGAPVNGALRYNSDANIVEIYQSSITAWTALSPLGVTWSSSGALAGAYEGDTYNVTVTAIPSYGSVTYSIVSGSLPTGLSLNTSTGAITGTVSAIASATQTFNFTIRASHNTVTTVTSDQSFSITITQVTITWTTLSGALGTAYESQSYSNTVSASISYGVVVYSVVSGSLPTGLSLNTSTGAISGTMGNNIGGTLYTFSIRAALSTLSSTRYVDRSFSITPTAVVVTLTTASGSLGSGVEGSSFSSSVAATSSIGSVTYSVTLGTLPAGVSLNSTTGAITGTLPSAATSTFTITATHSASTRSDSKSYSITSNVSTVTWSSSGSLGSDYTQRNSSFGVSVSTNYGSITGYSLVSGSIPSGHSLNTSTGTVSGTATGVSDYSSTTYSYTLRATNSYGRTADSALSITIYSRYIGYSCSTANEGGTCSDTAPGSYIFNRVDFSSYGTPNGSCGAFSIGGCNSGSSNGYNPTPTKSYSISSSNNQWGDPCGGTGKRMYVQMTYGPF